MSIFDPPGQGAPEPQPAPAPPPRKTDQWLEPGKTNLQVVYILYIASMFLPFLILVGIVIAYVNRGKAGGWVDTHYTWLIRTFWIGLLFVFVSIILAVVAVGLLLMVVMPIWVIVRCVVGLQATNREEPIKNPESWLI